MSEFVKRMIKVSVMVFLVAFTITASFLVGFGSGGIFYPISPVSVVAVSTLESPAGEEEMEKQFKVFWEAWHILERDFYGELPEPREMTYAAIRGVLSALKDEYTVFIEPELAKILRSDTTGSFEGIGASLHLNELSQVVIVYVFKGQPADEAGLMRGDIILKVDGESLEGKSLLEAVSLIRGPKGTTVRLTIQREGEAEPFEVPIVRRKIDIPIIESRILEGGIAYLYLAEFNAQAADKVKETLEDLLKEDPRGLVLDLRGNPGGLLNVSVEVASQFLEEGKVVVKEKGKSELEEVLKVGPGGLALEIPLVVLVNGATASGAEIVAGAIQDYKRGVLIGEKTLGKGAVQVTRALSDGSELRVTVAHWFTPNGHQIQGAGLTPDIEVEMTLEDFAAGRDLQLERAVEYLKTLGQ
ncbi:MAG: S41 family peptidase [Anaerolineae bacterium]